MDWISANPTVRYRVHWVIFFWPLWPSSRHCSSFGITTPSSCMMIDAVMYGMIPRKKTDTLVIAPPENRSRNPTTPALFEVSWRRWIWSKSTYGTGMCVPIR